MRGQQNIKIKEGVMYGIFITLYRDENEQHNFMPLFFWDVAQGRLVLDVRNVGNRLVT